MFHAKVFPRPLYLLSAFVSGLAVMAVEMTASRLLAPYFGNSLYVWTNVISVILVALAIGYALGGVIADRFPRPGLYFSFIWVTGLWTLVLPWVARPLFQVILSLSSSVQWGSLGAVFFLFFPPMLIWGMMVPFTLRLLVGDVKHVGRTAGFLSMISTAGSLLGSLLPAFVLIPWLGTMKTFFVCGLLLLCMANIGFRRVLPWIFTAGLVFFWTSIPSVFARADVIAAQDSPYGFIFVTEDAHHVRRLHIDTPLGTQSIYDPDSPLISDRYYYGYFGALPAMLDSPQSVLILGHAGGSFTRIFNLYYPDLDVTGVELDSEVTRMADEYLHANDLDVNVVHSDARTYLLNSDQHFDLILVDTYHGASIPPHLATQEFFELCASHLNQDGILALNAASTEGTFLDALRNSLAKPFGSTWSVPIPKSFNFLLATRKDMNFTPKNLSADLQALWDNLQEPQVDFYDPEALVFVDDRLSQVELEDERMFMQLLRDL